MPHESDLVDRLYDEFGTQPFDILLPSNAAAVRGDAPLFERGRSVLQTIIEQFLDSSEWRRWESSGGMASPLPNQPPAPIGGYGGGAPSNSRRSAGVGGAVELAPQGAQLQSAREPSPSPPPQWDGWD